MATILPEEVGVGCILSLPRPKPYVASVHDHNCEADCRPRLEFCHLKKKAYGHPIVILQLKRTDSELEIIFALISSFRRTRLEEFLELQSDSNSHMVPYVPISTSSDFRAALHYRFEGRGMLRQSYIVLPHRFTLPLSSFRTFANQLERPYAYSTRLDRDSYLRLMKRLNLPADDFVPTQVLRDNGARARYLEVHEQPRESLGDEHQTLTSLAVGESDHESLSSLGTDIISVFDLELADFYTASPIASNMDLSSAEAGPCTIAASSDQHTSTVSEPTPAALPARIDIHFEVQDEVYPSTWGQLFWGFLGCLF
ncbi:hypothetical protein PVAG01_07026 [Phlyctema vagabunda]|uniref:Uncharacterized protein n=1 Tax=Phlyctema vagabunda TaxID=108571 RepID=A0ABR4PB93_9HELO